MEVSGNEMRGNRFERPVTEADIRTTFEGITPDAVLDEYESKFHPGTSELKDPAPVKDEELI